MLHKFKLCFQSIYYVQLLNNIFETWNHFFNYFYVSRINYDIIMKQINMNIVRMTSITQLIIIF